MENYPIKSVTFGGFDKQDVVNYIQQAAQQAQQQQSSLQSENDRLREQVESLSRELSSLRSQLESLTAENRQLQQVHAQNQETAKELERLRPLAQEAERLRPDAEAYVQLRDRIGAIECDARKRADDLQCSVTEQLRKVVDQFREQYQTLTYHFASTASHVNTELRKVEVSLTQLPHALDQSGVELNELAARLEQSLKEKDKP